MGDIFDDMENTLKAMLAEGELNEGVVELTAGQLRHLLDMSQTARKNTVPKRRSDLSLESLMMATATFESRPFMVSSMAYFPATPATVGRVYGEEFETFMGEEVSSLEVDELPQELIDLGPVAPRRTKCPRQKPTRLRKRGITPRKVKRG